ncbi:cytochrome c biogenesis CcdA family protein [Homoserinibacter sp. YIM 151385]|uniref:cytochrome c biogenesis CcdA family protein n=1 Tax=Homoserinibacter sp. YIM 151385 TaxID=2985506 RepID=UPI0022F0BD4C|nr:cytochrome c biogenesis protein CcdA [Homoserinibacter sp. YIM 151385]WBU37012.1 cytochrome c biogenesis protein CcdA [Homoserinibacter sp. YIM 151385]
MGPGDIVTSGGLQLALPIALAAGLLSFLSPCVLPLVPGYLGYVSGATSGREHSRRRTALGAALFIAGFSIVFFGLFILAGTLGRFILEYQAVLLRVGGALVIVMGLVFIGQVTVLQRTVKPRWQPRTGLLGAPLLGLVFAIGWTPCISPTLTAMSTLALFGGDPGRAALIAAAYCIGLGIPFVLVALGFGWVGSSVRWVRRRIRLVNIIGGVLLIVVGVLMLTGLWQLVITAIGGFSSGFQNPL